jgi:UDP-N-acetylglucosamine transferase subunit ALG13
LIFVTVGTHQDPFGRMIAAVEALPNRAEVVVQYGPGDPPAGVARAAAFISFAEMEANFEAAESVITHAGVGSILCARRAGHVPVVIPRMHNLGEHVDDHQQELTRALAERGEVIPVWPGEDLATVLATVPPRRRGPLPGKEENPLVDAVAAALGGEPERH